MPGEGVFAGFDTIATDYGLGYCGLNTIEDYVWANINHASEYGVGALCLLGYRLRNRRR